VGRTEPGHKICDLEYAIVHGLIRGSPVPCLKQRIDFCLGTPLRSISPSREAAVKLRFGREVGPGAIDMWWPHGKKAATPVREFTATGSRVKVKRVLTPFFFLRQQALALSRDGKKVAGGTCITGNGAVVVWDVPSGKELKRLQN
jgi:hypothetical protein